MQTRSKSDITKPNQKWFYKTIVDNNIIETPSFGIASKFPNWGKAMDEEFQALRYQHTWISVPPPSNKNNVGSKWVFKIKRNSDGTITR